MTHFQKEYRTSKSAEIIFFMTVVVMLLEGPLAVAATVPLPVGATERRVSIKPDELISRKTELLIDGSVRGERLYYSKDNLYQETLLKNGVADGLTRRWHKNGQLWEERPYVNGVLSGTCRNWDVAGKALMFDEIVDGCGVLHEFHANAILESECPLVTGLKQGFERTWYEDGKLMTDTAFESGKKEGWSRNYYPNGRLMQESFFKNDQFHGVLRIWDEAGRPEHDSPSYYVDGNEVSMAKFVDLARNDRDLRRSLESISVTKYKR